MKKMKTLFKRQFVNHKIAKCLNEIEPECQWVLNGIERKQNKLTKTY